MITVEQLFKEDFKPQWLLKKEAAIKESLDHALTVGIEFKWRQEAKKSETRILAKHLSPKLPYFR